MDVEATLKQFIADDITAEAFQEALFGNSDAFQEYLENDPDIDPYGVESGSVFLFLLGQDLTTPKGALDAQTSIKAFFERK